MNSTTEAAQALLHPDNYRGAQPEKPPHAVRLPETFAHFTSQWPEAIPFLRSLAKANPPNFLHMAMVHELSTHVANDLLMLYPRATRQFKENVLHELDFSMMHDAGKVMVGPDFDKSNILVHPVSIWDRPREHNGLHWGHPTFSAQMLSVLAQVSPKPLARSLNTWSRQALLHHRDFLSFAVGNNAAILHEMTQEAWLAHFVFSISDVAVAAKMERPNGPGGSQNERIRQVLRGRNITDATVRLFLGESVNPEFVRPFLLESCMGHLARLRQAYSPSDCIDPKGFVAPGFLVDVSAPSPELDLLEILARGIWQEHEPKLLGPISRMDAAGVLEPKIYKNPA